MTNCTAADLFDQLGPHYDEGGMCVSSEDDKAKIITELNAAIPLLMKRLDAKGTIWEWFVPCNGGIIALPLDCLEVRQAWMCGKSLEQRDEWFVGKLGMDDCKAEGGCNGSTMIDLGDGYALPYKWPDYHFDARFAVMAESDGDAGKEVQVEIRDRYGATQREMLVLGGSQLLTVSENAATDITFFKKPATVGVVRRYIYYPQTNARVLMDSLPPAIKNVSYRKKRLPQSFYGGDGVLKVKGKRRFIPIQSENDPLPICDPEALGFAFQALAAMRRKDLQAYNSSLAMAINEATREMADSQSNALVQQMSFKSGLGRQVGAKCWS